jgi:subfamily B ATP-binding cassette protein MsbA
MVKLIAASPNDLQLYLRLLRYVLPYRLLFLLSLVAMIVLALADASKAAILKPMLDGAFIDNDPDLMVRIPLYLVGLFIVSGVATFISAASLHWIANKVIMDLREQMYARLLSLPSRFYDETSTGSIISRFTYDVIQIREATTNAITVMVKDALVIIGLLAWMFYLDWRMTLITLIGSPFVLLIVYYIRRRLRQMSGKVQQSMGEINRVVDESIGGQRIIKLFGGQDYEKDKFHDAINANRRFNMKFINATVISGPAIQLVAAIALAVIVYYAAAQSAQGQLSVGTFVSFFAALIMMLDALRRLVKVNEFIQKGLSACESVFGLIDEQGEVDNGIDLTEPLQGNISINGLGFSYDGNIDVLHDISVSISAGETIALVGTSGSGKTTLASLIPRFYQQNQGSILIDGHDSSAIKLASLRNNIALVSQDIVLFNDTVRNNIAYGSLRNASDAEVRLAADTAHASEFIERLPQGMQTMLGENGARLSGGQRQRIALARALLKKAPILILDEATSALDSESERHIQMALEEIRHRHTCIIIAHRLSTIESADRIIVLDKGNIVEVGNHAELIRRNGTYAHLYSSRQFD